MSFSNTYQIVHSLIFLKFNQRKEKDSFLTHHVMSTNSIITPIIKKKRTSFCTSQQVQGNITVEAAVTIPIFFFAFVCILYVLELLAIQANVRSGMYATMDKLVVDVSRIPYISTASIETYLQEAIGEEWLLQSNIVNGSEGIDCSESHVSIRTGVIDLKAKYKVQLPIGAGYFGALGMQFEESMRAKGWTGYVSGVFSDWDEFVYITDEASVYHTRYNCTHLQLSIQGVSARRVERIRNEYGSNYIPCSKCIENGKSVENYTTLYVATSGNHYHSTLSCSGLKRTIHATPISQAIGKGVCSRCGN